MIGSLELFQPTTVQEASQALAELGDKAKIYAGGAELLLLLLWWCWQEVDSSQLGMMWRPNP